MCNKLLRLAGLALLAVALSLQAEPTQDGGRTRVVSSPQLSSSSSENTPFEDVGSLMRSGGPDGFGYVFKDSDEPDGPSFNWIEISDVGTALNMMDESRRKLELPFSFTFYDLIVDSITVSSNGIIGIPSLSSAYYSNSSLPYSSEPYIICPLWDDLNPSANGDAYWYQDPSGEFVVIEWKEVPHYYSKGSFTFEVVIYRDGGILFQYLELDSLEVLSATVGIQGDEGQDNWYLEYSYNQYSDLHDSLAILFYMPPKEHDVGVLQVIEPTEEIFVLGANIVPKAIVGNFGLNTETFDVVAEIRTAKQIYTSTKTVTELESGDTTTVVFDPYVPTENGVFELVVYTQLQGDENARNDTVTKALVVADFVLDFEDNDGKFFELPLNTEWEWGEPVGGPGGAHSGTKLWGTNLDGNYSSNDDIKLCKAFVITGNSPSLHFMHWLDGERHYDGGNLKLSTDRGNTWTLITPVGGYPDSARSGTLAGQRFYSVVSEWTHETFDLSGVASLNDTIYICWHFGSDAVFESMGWYIDDVAGVDIQAYDFQHDIGILSVYPDSQSFFKNDTTQIYAVVKNKGVSTETFDVILSINTAKEAYVETVRVFDLPPDAIDTVWFSQHVFTNLGTFLLHFRHSLTDDEYSLDDTLSSTVFVHDFIVDLEGDNDGFLYPSPPVNGWEWEPVYYLLDMPGPESAHSGEKAWGTKFEDIYDTNAHWTLTGRFVATSDSPELYFYHWYEMEIGDDGGNLKISTDNGNTWTLIVPEGGYPVVLMASNPYMPNEPAFSGYQTTWNLVRFNLADYLGKGDTFLLKWEFASDGHQTHDAGWYIDDIAGNGFEILEPEHDVVAKRIDEPMGLLYEVNSSIPLKATYWNRGKHDEFFDAMIYVVHGGDTVFADTVEDVFVAVGETVTVSFGTKWLPSEEGEYSVVSSTDDDTLRLAMANFEAVTELLSDDESDTFLTSFPPSGLWEYGPIIGGPGNGFDDPEAWATDRDGDYLPSTYGSLLGELIPDNDTIEVAVVHWYDMDEDDYKCPAGGNFQYYDESLQTWKTVYPDPPYGVHYGPGDNPAIPQYDICFSGRSYKWRLVRYRIENVTPGQNVRIRFNFGASPDAIPRYGWALDRFGGNNFTFVRPSIHDVSPRIKTPENGAVYNTNQYIRPSVMVRNFGDYDENVPVRLEIQTAKLSKERVLKGSGASEAIDFGDGVVLQKLMVKKAVYDTVLAVSAHDSVEWVLSDSILYTSEGVYYAKAITLLTTDENATNDTDSVSFSISQGAVVDGGVDSVIVPFDTVLAGTPITASAIVHNYGQTAISCTLYLRVFLQTQLVFSNRKTLTDLQPDSVDTVEFDPFTPNVGGDYTFVIYLIVPGDGNDDNDTARKTVHVISHDIALIEIIEPSQDTYAIGTGFEPSVNVQNVGTETDTFEVHAEIYTTAKKKPTRKSLFDAPTEAIEGGTKDQLVYQDDTTLVFPPGYGTNVVFDMFAPTQTGTYYIKFYSVLATDSNHSNDTLVDTFAVTTVYHEVEIVEIVEPAADSVDYGDSVQPQIRVTNVGDVQEDIPVHVEFCGGYHEVQTARDVDPGDTVLLTFPWLHFNTPGPCDFTTYTAISGDNDTMIKPMFVNYYDVGVSFIDEPSEDVYLVGDSFYPSATVESYSNVAVETPVIAEIWLGRSKSRGAKFRFVSKEAFDATKSASKNDTLVYADTVNVVFVHPSPIPPSGAEFEQFTVPDSGEYTVVIYTALPNDMNTANDADTTFFTGVLRYCDFELTEIIVPDRNVYHVDTAIQPRALVTNNSNFGEDATVSLVIVHLDSGDTLRNSKVYLNAMDVGESREAVFDDFEFTDPGYYEFTFFVTAGINKYIDDNPHNDTLSMTVFASYHDLSIWEIIEPEDGANYAQDDTLIPKVAVKNLGVFKDSAYVVVELDYAKSLYSDTAFVVLDTAVTETLQFRNLVLSETGDFVFTAYFDQWTDDEPLNDTDEVSFRVSAGYVHDVGISAIIEPVGEYQQGEKVVPEVEVTNYGQDFETFDIVAQLATAKGVVYCDTITGASLPPGEVDTVLFDTLELVDPGDYEFTSFVLITDDDPTNDTGKSAVHVTAIQHDVALVRILEPAGISYDLHDFVFPAVEVENVGDVDESVPVRLVVEFNGNSIYDQVDTMDVPMGQTVIFVFDSLAFDDYGTYDFTFIAELQGDVDPSNDTLRKSVSVLLHDLVLVEIIEPVNDTAYCIDSTIHPRVVVSNVGNVDEDFDIISELYHADSTLISAWTVNGFIAAGDVDTFTLTDFNLPTAGRYSYLVYLEMTPNSNPSDDTLSVGFWGLECIGDSERVFYPESVAVSWEFGQPDSNVCPNCTPIDGDNAWCTNLDGYYGNNLDDWLLSPDMAITTSEPIFAFFHLYNLASGDTASVWVRNVSTGSDWSLIASYTGSIPTWEHVVVNLATVPGFAFSVGDMIQVGFRLQTDDSDTSTGWCIDQVCMEGIAREFCGDVAIIEWWTPPVGGAVVQGDAYTLWAKVTNAACGGPASFRIFAKSFNSDGTLIFSSAKLIRFLQENETTTVYFSPNWIPVDYGTHTIEYLVRKPGDPNPSNNEVSFSVEVAPMGGGKGSELGIPTTLVINVKGISSNPNRIELTFGVPHDSWVEIKVYDPLGRLVRTLASGRFDAGYYELAWDCTTENGQRISNGVYFVTISDGKKRITKRLVVIE